MTLVSICLPFQRNSRAQKIKIMKKISCRVAEVADYDIVLELIRECYYKEEQITVSHPDPGQTKDDEEFTMSHIYHGTVTVAIDDENGKIIGALIAGPIEHGDAEKMLESAQTCETKKWSDIQKLLVYIEMKADVLGKFNLEKALHCHALGVDKEYRGNKIGQKMFRHCFENAKILGFEMVSADFTSIYSIKLAEDLGMEFVSLVTYEEYNKSIGEDLFRIQEPNTEIKTFIMRL